MLYNRSDSSTYIQEFRKRFTNFCEKSPVLLSFTTTGTGVKVINESTDVVYDFEFDYTLPVKQFIFGIKQILVEECYPILNLVIEEEESISMEEQIAIATDEDTPIEKVPTKRIVEKSKRFLIDKVIIFRDTFIVKDLTTEKMYRYKLNGSAVLFLNNMRSSEDRKSHLTPEKAAQYFFKHSQLLNEIVEKQDETG